MRTTRGMLAAASGLFCTLLFTTWFTLLFTTLFTAAPALAHHGFDTEYDAKKKVKLTGVVTQVAWTNPHMRVYIDVTGPDGKVTNWNLELTSPNRIRRQGWGPNDLLPGEKVTFEGYGGKVVESRGSLLSIVKAGESIPLFEEGGPETAGQQRPDGLR